MTTETTRHWVAVRCCCTPNKVLGFLQLDADAMRSGRVYSPHSRAPIEIREIGESVACESGVTYARERAVYSEDRPIEFWRNIPGFVEAVAQNGRRGVAMDAIYRGGKCPPP